VASPQRCGGPRRHRATDADRALVNSKFGVVVDAWPMSEPKISGGGGEDTFVVVPHSRKLGADSFPTFIRPQRQ